MQSEPLAIWFTPESPGVQASITIAVDNGPKQYLRLWMHQLHARPEWSWHLHPTSILLWEANEAGT